LLRTFQEVRLFQECQWKLNTLIKNHLKKKPILILKEGGPTGPDRRLDCVAVYSLINLILSV